MYSLGHITRVHLEISSVCNAACPLCPRNYHGYPYNAGYVERNLTLDEVKHIFSEEFVGQLHTVLINGNYGDMVMNPQAVEIMEYFRLANPALHIAVSTNGAARSAEFWRSLAELGTRVFFCLDGLEDTHSLYRLNTVYSTVIRNAETFIAAGGDAVWKFIPFDHNRHQIETARKLSQDLKFNDFVVTDYGRNNTPVFDKNQQLSHVIGTPGWRQFVEPGHYHVDRHWQQKEQVKTPITCQALQDQELYVSSEGRVYPCCHIGASVMSNPAPRHQQIRSIQHRNSALESKLEDCIQWFNAIEATWAIESFEKGRLITCNKVCGG